LPQKKKVRQKKVRSEMREKVQGEGGGIASEEVKTKVLLSVNGEFYGKGGARSISEGEGRA